MASDFCNIPSSNETSQILKLLPALPSIQRLVNVILQKVEDIKNKFILKIEEYLSQFELGCPTPEEIEKIISIRNRAVTELKKVYNSVDRIADNISGIAGFVTLVVTIVRVAQTAISVASLSQLVAPFIPAAVLAKINAATEIAQGVIDKVRFKTDGDPKLVPIVNGIISANIAIQLFALALKNLICQIEALDPQILACVEDGTEVELTPIDPSVVSFVETTLAENQESVIETTYRGFVFELEKVPFSSTVNRTRANALNKDGIVILQSELSFTKDPSVLIEELKFVIDRDNLRAE
jgi:hypothetical protein